MFGLGTIINTVAVVVGGLMGLVLKNGIKEGVHNILMQACGVSTIFIGAAGVMSKMLVITDGGIETAGTMLLIFSLVIGSFLGELLGIEHKMDSAGEKIKQMVKRQHDNLFVDGFVNVSLIICVGAMAIVGSMQDGISGDYSMLAAKSVLDFVIVMIFTSTHGIGSIFSALPLFIYQGAITVIAAIFGSFVSEGVINDLSLVGSALIFCVGANLCFGKKIKVGNMLPALVVAAIYNPILNLFS
ncbi:MAG: DUF554 domain-containing protein [Eubacteriales bacterium]|nr:DUF554 domain-containing protein [Eubacteriales bacterium]